MILCQRQLPTASVMISLMTAAMQVQPGWKDISILTLISFMSEWKLLQLLINC